MFNPKQQSDVDQAAAEIGDNLPKFWFRIYRGCVEAGFTQEQAFRLLLTFVGGNLPKEEK
jgi:hypothetical protein